MVAGHRWDLGDRHARVCVEVGDDFQPATRILAPRRQQGVGGIRVAGESALATAVVR